MRKKSPLTRSIGARIRLFREGVGRSLEDVAWAINVDKSHLSRIERGERAPSVAVLFAIAEQVGATAADLVGIGKDRRMLLLEATRGLDDEKLEDLLRMAHRS